MSRLPPFLQLTISLCLSVSISPFSLHVCMSCPPPPFLLRHHPQYRVFHFKKLVKKLIIVMKWMKSQQASKPPALEMPGGHKRLAGARKRSATVESSYTHRPPRTTRAGIKKASSVDYVMHHMHGQGQGNAPGRATDILGTSRIREGHLGALGQSMYGCNTALVGSP